MTDARPILVTGLPRSGTTWTIRAFASAPGTVRISEPDNEDKYPAALHGKRKVGRYPVLAPGDRAPEYRRLWEWTLSGAREGRREALARRLLGPGYTDRIHDGPMDAVTWVASTLARDPRPHPGGAGSRVIAKSIHCQLAAEWLASEFDLDVVLLLRHPANVLASWMEVKLKDARHTTLESRADVRSRYVDRWGVPLPGPDPLERICWRIALLTAAIEELAARHPTWVLRIHEQLCLDPIEEFPRALRHARAALGTLRRRIHRRARHTGIGLRGQAGRVRARRRLAGEAGRRPARDLAQSGRMVPDHDLERSGLRVQRVKCTTQPALPSEVRSTTRAPASAARGSKSDGEYPCTPTPRRL